MTKTTGNFTDFVSFSRASGGTALRKISYGSELVTNGTFDTDTSGWTFEGTATNTSAAGYLEGITGAATNVLVSAPITTVIGKTYVVTGDVVSTNNFGAIFAGSSIYAQNLGSTGYMTSGSFGTFTFKATTTTTYISVLAGDANKTVRVDNISVKEVLFDRADGTLQLFNHPTNVPRVEYDASGNRKGLLIEEARTNLLTYSVPTTTNWTTSQASLTNNATTAPDGSSSAAKLVEDATSNNHYGQSPSASIASGSVCGTAYLKAGERKYARIRLEGTTSGSRAWFDLDLGTVSYADPSGVATIQSVGGGWYRCSVTEPTNVASATTAKVQVFVQSVTGSQTSYTGDGTSGIYVWGAQLEAGAFPTSYIPSSGATATRAADICSIATSAFGYNQNAGTVVVEFETPSLSAGYISDQTSATSVAYSSNRDFKTFNGTSAAITSNQFTLGEVAKGVTAYSNAGRAVCLNGGAVASDTGKMQNVTTYKFGQSFGGSYLNGHIKSIRYFPRRLSNAQLQALTA